MQRVRQEHDEQFEHVIPSAHRNNDKCFAGEANSQLKDPNASGNTQQLDAALALHGSPASRAGGDTGVQTILSTVCTQGYTEMSNL